MLPQKKVTFDKDARASLQRGINILADAVKRTLGPKGLNAALKRSWGAPLITKDGVTVAREIFLKDQGENQGAQLVKEVASKTNELAGDGTTTSTVLAQALVNEGLKRVEDGVDAQDIRKGIEKATEAIVARIKEMAIPVDADTIKHVASISANDQELGQIIGDAFNKLGEYGTITIDEGSKPGIEVETVEGLQFDSGVATPFLMTDRTRQIAELKNCVLLVTDLDIKSMPLLLEPLKKILQTGTKDIVLIGKDFGNDVLASLAVNMEKNNFRSLAINCPSFGDNQRDILEDIAILTGATFVSAQKGNALNTIEATVLGKAGKIVSDKKSTLILNGGGSPEAIAARVASIRQQLEETEQEDQLRRSQLQDRLAAMTGGVGVIHVGGSTDAEAKERKDRVVDAVSATRAAKEEGIVAGGGTIFLQATKDLVVDTANDGERAGVEIVIEACKRPFLQILENAGNKEGATLMAQVLSNGPRYGYDSGKGAYIEDMVAHGIIDPAKVSRCAIQHAASIAIMVLTTAVLVVDEEQEDEE